MNATASILSIEHLTKKYGTNIAVNDVSLSISRGAFYGLLGPNGAGKSSIIHCITGISTVTSGTITIDGVDAVTDYKEARKKVGLSPQEFNVDIFATPEQLLDYVGGYYGMKKEERLPRREELLTRFDLQQHRKKKFQQLSGGLKRRVMLARGLMHAPELLILDEPTAGVDVEQRHDLWDYLRELNEQRGKTIILTSHYLEEVEHLCNEIAIINNGKIVAQGSKGEFIKEGNSLESKYLEITRGESY